MHHFDLVDGHLGGLGELAQVLGRTHKRWTATEDERDRFAHLLTRDALNTLLDTHRLEPPRMRLAADGDTVPEHVYCTRRTPRRMAAWWQPHPDLLAAQLRDGATLVVDAIEQMHPPIAALAAGLERHLRTGVQVNLYASYTSREGFGVHWDDHDVIVVQVSGAKRWRIYGTTRVAPMYRDVAFDTDTPTTVLDEFTMRAGDVLHVPRGCWHAAAASEGEPSVHLTCGLATRTGIDLLSWVVDKLRAHEIARLDVPVYATPAERATWQDQLVKTVTAALADPRLVEDFLTGRDIDDPTRGGFALPYAVTRDVPDDPALTVRLVPSRPVLVCEDDQVTLAAAGRRFTFAPAAAPALQLLADGQPVLLGTLYAANPAVPRAGIRALVTALVVDGIVTVGGTSWQ